MAEEPCKIRGCTERPLFDAVPVENFIISLLHIIIGMGNALVDGLIEFIEARVEKLEKVEIEARNRTIFATIMLDNAKEEYTVWLENDGILLTELQLEKQQIKHKLSERVSTITNLFDEFNRIFSYLQYFFYRLAIKVPLL